MDLLIKSAQIIDKNSSYNGQLADILIEGGFIKNISKIPLTKNNIPVFEADDLHVSIGWFDIQSNIYDPGADNIEDLNSGCAAAAAGGFTGIACMPSKYSRIESKSDVEYILNKAKKEFVDVYPIGALTKNMEGKNMSEMFDMSQSGAVAFSDNKYSIQEAAVLARCLLYAKGFSTRIIHYPEDSTISNNGNMNEGATSTKMGVKGIPAIAEELTVMRDISLAEFHNCAIHLSSISTAKSVNLVRAAKQKGIQITCGVSVNNLVLADEDLIELDSNLKLKPPLRSISDKDALWDGLKDGTIDCIYSDHTPQAIESKECEFDYASDGMIGLETTYALLNRCNKTLAIDVLIDKISSSPRNILNLSIPKLAIGEKANLTLFSKSKKWIYSHESCKSKSRNSFFMNTELTGKALALIHNNQLYEID